MKTEPVMIATKAIPNGDRKLVLSGSNEYLVIDRVGEAITKIQTFQEKEFTKAATAFSEGI